MESNIYFVKFENSDIKGTPEPQTTSHHQDEGKTQKCRGCRCLVLMTVCLGLICVLLLVFNILQHNTIISYKNTVEEFNQTINSLKGNNTDLMIEKAQLQNNFSSLSQKKLELETRVNNLTAEKSQLQNSLNSLSQKKLELESKVTSLSDELKKAYVKGNQWGWFFLTPQLSWSNSRQYCKNNGGDLIILNTEAKQWTITSLLVERVWIGLNDIQQEGIMKWVDTSALNQGFWFSGEPNDAGGNEDCVELLPSVPLQNWNDLPCTDSRKGICEK